MPKRSRQRKEQHSVVDDAASGDGDRFPLHTTTWYDKPLESLGHPDATFVVAKLQQRFERDWLGNAPLADLSSSWEYKQVSDREACRRLDVRQIRVGKDIRVLFAIDHERRTTYYLDVYHKTGKSSQNDAIARACSHARTIRGGEDGGK